MEGRVRVRERALEPHRSREVMRVDMRGRGSN